jgi:hypothetical protein
VTVVDSAEAIRGTGEQGRDQKPSKRGVELTEKSASSPQEESKVVQ